MSKQSIRRSDRVSLELPIRISGRSARGPEFSLGTRTLLLSRYGANILLDRELIPQSPLSVFCPETDKEAEARYVGMLREEAVGPTRAIEFLDGEINLWNISFPPLSESTRAVARLLLECACCHTVELSYLREVEALTFGISGFVMRQCGCCDGSRLWRHHNARGAGKQRSWPAAPSPWPEPAWIRPRKMRKERPENLWSPRFPVCVRGCRWGEELATAEKVSREGFRFKSWRKYAANEFVDVAVPYISESGNIFFPARIVPVAGNTGKGPTHYSVSYVPIHHGWPKS